MEYLILKLTDMSCGILTGLLLVGLLVVVVKYTISVRQTIQRSDLHPRGAVTEKRDQKLPAPVQPLHEFDWRTKTPSQFRPFKPIFHITMALQADTPSEWITVDQDYLDRIKLRKQLILEHPTTVHGYVPAGMDAVQELYQSLFKEYLPTRYPTMFKLAQVADRTEFQNLVTGDQHPVAAPEDPSAALRAIGTTVEEDMFLLKPTSDGHQCVAYVCCFPSGWNPAEKLGKHMARIHATVPGYEKIGPSMERFFGKLEVGKSVKRTNWTVQTHSDMFTPAGNHIHDDGDIQQEKIDVSKTFVRIELQTLSRLPQSHSVLFSFKTYLYPIRELKEEGLGPQLADAVEGLRKGNVPGMWRYKSAVR